MGEDAVAFRLQELQASILSANEELRSLNAKIEYQIKENMSLSNQSDNDHKDILDKINRNHCDELSADVVLTEHYKDDAAEACIHALMKQQDVMLLKEKESLKDLVLKYADSHLQSKEKSLLSALADEKAAALTEEEERYMHRVQLAIIQHKERMARTENSLHDEMSP